MTDYIKLWLEIIENMNNDNTYKLAWGRALLELILEIDDVKDDNIISFNDIAKKMLKYYWNQIYFFNLKQSPSKVPVIVQETEKCIEFVSKIRESNMPIWFDQAEIYLKEDLNFYQKEIKKIATKLTHDVSWRFKIVKGDSLEIYNLDIPNREVHFTKSDVYDLKEYTFVLSQLLNYRWAQLSEKFNNSPKITLKVKGISDKKIRRNNLRKYRDILLEQMDDGKIIDFYTDDIWNLVLTSKFINSKKSNVVPSEEIIKKLESRNIKLLKVVKEEKYKKELQIAIDKDYVRKFYLSFKL